MIKAEDVKGKVIHLFIGAFCWFVVLGIYWFIIGYLVHREFRIIDSKVFIVISWIIPIGYQFTMHSLFILKKMKYIEYGFTLAFLTNAILLFIVDKLVKGGPWVGSVLGIPFYG